MFLGYTAKLNGIENIRFVAADSKDYAKALAEDGEHIDVAFIDPPRAGCSASFLKSLSGLSPDCIVYISCNPETQARDLLSLVRGGYAVKKIQPVDMFPFTSHVESVVCLTKENGTPERRKDNARNSRA
jgi:23S rRNA (uracil1939-C5)-methyltransferase